MTQLRLQELLGRANLLLDKGFHVLPGFVVIKNADMEALLDRIDASIPEDIKEAESILRRREELQLEAQSRAERIINDAQSEASRLLSEDELTKAVKQEAIKVREQFIQECEEMKRNALSEAETLKAQAREEAMKIKIGAENYAEQILSSLADTVQGMQDNVRNCYSYLNKIKTVPQQPQYSSDMHSQRYQNEDFDYDDDEI